MSEIENKNVKRLANISGPCKVKGVDIIVALWYLESGMKNRGKWIDRNSKRKVP